MTEIKTINDKKMDALKLFGTLKNPVFQYGLGMSMDFSSIDLIAIEKKLQQVPEALAITAPKGVLVHRLADAPPEIIQQYFDQLVPASENKFAALHYAYLQRGLVVVIPKDTEIDEPIHIDSLLSDSAAEHIILIAEANSKVTILESSISQEQVSYKSQVVQVYAKENSQVTWCTVQHLHPATDSITFKRGKAAQNASIAWMDVLLGGKLNQLQIRTILSEPGANSAISTAFCSNGLQQFDLNGESVHQAAHTASGIYSKGVLMDHSDSIIRGKITINKNAHHCSGHQKAQALLIGEQARCNAIPVLEVQNDEVICSHGATIGQLDEEQLFYLLSRGLNEKTATQIILAGFLEPIISKIQNEQLKEKISQLLSQKITNLKEHELAS
ncbi:TPA: Fe-S cluster assembly protein SufD [Candidatus Woesearchaeota archaeon]|nr:Fe-S cluster assembly protein SufD [Candidatus Woesearchaeota archaeon]HIG92928.1 Fe-S cluster assembly protein SufD [Candidatus Woesearchaeota archaeon]